MIDFEKAKQEFMKYVNKFDTENNQIQRKIGHSIRVMELSEKIAKRENFAQEETEIAKLIGLLHDIGRFEQYTKYGTFSDIRSIDHGMLAVEILKKDEYIRKFIKEKKYDEIIMTAIKNHNQYGIEEGLNEKKIKFCKLIKDADKIDILYQGTEKFWQNETKKQEIENSIPSKEVWKEWKNKILIKNEAKSNELDHMIGMISFIFDLNFRTSIEILKEKKYCEKIIERFDYKQEETREKIKEMKKEINEF